MDKKAITLQQLEEALRDLTGWLRDKLKAYVAEPAAEGKSGYVLTTNGAGGRSWEPFGTVKPDESLSQTGIPADAAAVGAAVEELRSAAANAWTEAKSAQSAAERAQAAAEAKIPRAKLADNALYSPIMVVSGDVILSEAHLGYTINFTDTTQSVDHVFTIPKETSAMLPVGFEMAILFAMGRSMKIIFSGGVGAGISGHGWSINPTVTIPEKYSMVAIKKINNSNNWLVTGNVEVTA